MSGGFARVGPGGARVRPGRGWCFAFLLLIAAWALIVASPVSAQGVTHVVRPGETLALIAAQHGTSGAAIALANDLTSPDLLWIGQELWIPLETSDLQSAASSNSHAYHVVQLGDTLADIAFRYKVSLPSLIQTNGISDPELLWVGQRLLIPGGYAASTPSALATATPRPFLPLSDILLTSTPTPTGAPIPAAGQSTAQPVGSADVPGATRTPMPPTPVGQQEGATTGSQAVPGVVETPVPKKHTVAPGDTLGAIARKHDTTAAAIARLNGLTSPDLIHVGLELLIPYKDWTAPLFPGQANRFVVSISQQRCWLYQGNVQIADWLCSTGQRGTATRPGTYAIQSKMEKAYGSAWNIWMPYWLGIYWAGASENGIHGLPYDADSGYKLWEGLVGSPVTYGCVLLTDEHAAILFDMAYVGMPVIIQP